MPSRCTLKTRCYLLPITRSSPLSTQQLEPFDFIVNSELYYVEELFPLLLWTMRQFSSPQTVIWSCFIDRPFS
jgi:hypothetical protein